MTHVRAEVGGVWRVDAENIWLDGVAPHVLARAGHLAQKDRRLLSQVGLVPTLHYHATLNPLREFSNDGRTVRTVLRRLRRRQRIQIHHAFSRSPASRLIGFIRHRSALFATDRYIMRQIATYKEIGRAHV